MLLAALTHNSCIGKMLQKKEQIFFRDSCNLVAFGYNGWQGQKRFFGFQIWKRLE
jgi:hypothetical protein